MQFYLGVELNDFRSLDSFLSYKQTSKYLLSYIQNTDSTTNFGWKSDKDLQITLQKCHYFRNFGLYEHYNFWTLWKKIGILLF